jgi:hypothetical protein
LGETIDIETHKNRLLKFCYVPANSAAHNRLLFLLQLFTVLMKKTRAIKQSIFLDSYGRNIPIEMKLKIPAIKTNTAVTSKYEFN